MVARSISMVSFGQRHHRYQKPGCTRSNAPSSTVALAATALCAVNRSLRLRILCSLAFVLLQILGVLDGSPSVSYQTPKLSQHLKKIVKNQNAQIKHHQLLTFCAACAVAVMPERVFSYGTCNALVRRYFASYAFAFESSCALKRESSK